MNSLDLRVNPCTDHPVLTFLIIIPSPPGRTRRPTLPHLNATAWVGDRVRERDFRAPAVVKFAEDFTTTGGGPSRAHAAAAAAEVPGPISKRSAYRREQRKQKR